MKSLDPHTAERAPSATDDDGPSPESVLTELVALSMAVNLQMHDEEIVHAYLTSLSRLLPGRLLALRLFDPETRELSLVYATGRLHQGRRERVFVSEGALLASGLEPAKQRAVLDVVPGYISLFREEAGGFDVALSDGLRLMGVLAVEEAFVGQSSPTDRARLMPIVLALTAALRNARLLRESLYLRDYLSKLVEHANAPILVVGKKHEIRVVNRALLGLTGYRREELLHRDLLSLLDDESRARLLPILVGALRGQSATGVEVRVSSRRGAAVRLMVNTAAVLSADGEVEGVIAIGRDVTEIRALEQRIIQAEKLATVGQLAAGVVHELNNPLTSISVYSDYLLKQAEARGQDASESLKLRRIHESAGRILRFTRELLAYARPSSETPTRVELPTVVARALEFCEPVLAQSGTELHLELAPDLPSLLGVQGQLEQVLVNLCTNACHAMPEGAGLLTIRAERVDEGGDDEPTIELSVSDNGSGISPDHQKHIFEPFFSTKGEGHGTGLGLSIVRNIVDLHGGAISVQSELGTGTTFSIRLPARGLDQDVDGEVRNGS